MIVQRGDREPARRRGGLIAVMTLLAVGSLPAAGQGPPDFSRTTPQALVRSLRTTPPEARGALLAALVERRREVLPIIREQARSGRPEEKFLACSVIAELRDRDGVGALLDASRDGNVKVRRRATTALRILADPRAAGRLRELARTESDLGVLKIALAALGRLGDRRDVALIEPHLTHASDAVRVVAAAALAMLGDERGLDLVIMATHAADPAVQKSATYALGMFGAPAAGERLQAILGDPAGAWRGYALVAQAERTLVQQTAAERIATLERAATRGRSRTLVEWAVDRLTDIGTPDAAAALGKVRDRPTPAGAMAARRLRLLEAQP